MRGVRSGDGLRLETVGQCPLCSSGRLRKWRVSTDRRHGVSQVRFRFSCCRRCGARFLSLRPVEADAHLGYPQSYEPYDANSTSPGDANSATPPWGYLPAAPSLILRALLKLGPYELPSALARVYEPRENGEALLDIGAGSTRFLDWARAIGWTTIGMDLSLQVVERLRQAGHQAFPARDEAWAAIKDGSLSAVRMNHVIEHVYEPRDMLRRSLGKLKEGGRIHIATPNPLGMSSLVFRSWWDALDPPRHVFLFAPAVLARTLESVGFRDIRVLHEIVTKDAARSLANRLQGRQQPNRGNRLGRVDPQQVEKRLVTLAYLAAKLRIADRFHIVART